jgi:iron complex transport system ATP-binding protein
MTAEALRIQGLSYRIGAAAILRDVTFAVRTGEFASLIGPNGAGKTTLLKCLNRIVTGASGRVEILGKPLASYRQRDLARRVSYVPQADGRLVPFTVYEFVLMGRYPYLSPFASIGPADRAAVNEALAATGTAAFGDRCISTLSGGECQKVFIAAALAQQAEILLLDEPTTFLDYRHRLEIMSLLGRLNREAGLTMLAVTHDLSPAVMTGDRVIALKEGAVAFDGSPGELTEENALQEIYGTRFRFVTHPETGDPVALPCEGESP